MPSIGINPFRSEAREKNISKMNACLCEMCLFIYFFTFFRTCFYAFALYVHLFVVTLLLCVIISIKWIEIFTMKDEVYKNFVSVLSDLLQEFLR